MRGTSQAVPLIVLLRAAGAREGEVMLAESVGGERVPARVVGHRAQTGRVCRGHFGWADESAYAPGFVAVTARAA